MSMVVMVIVMTVMMVMMMVIVMAMPVMMMQLARVICQQRVCRTSIVLKLSAATYSCP